MCVFLLWWRCRDVLMFTFASGILFHLVGILLYCLLLITNLLYCSWPVFGHLVNRPEKLSIKRRVLRFQFNEEVNGFLGAVRNPKMKTRVWFIFFRIEQEFARSEMRRQEEELQRKVEEKDAELRRALEEQRSRRSGGLWFYSDSNSDEELIIPVGSL